MDLFFLQIERKSDIKTEIVRVSDVIARGSIRFTQDRHVGGETFASIILK